MEKMGPSYIVVENVKWCHVENSLEVSEKFNSYRMTWRVHSEVHTQEKWRHYAHTKACIIHNIKSKTIQVSVKTGQTKYSIVWCLNNGILFSKRETSDTRYGMDEPWKCQRSQSQRITYCMIPFIWNVQNRQTQRDTKQVSGYQEQGWGWGKTPSGNNVLKLHCLTTELCLHNSVNVSKTTGLYI